MLALTAVAGQPADNGTFQAVSSARWGLYADQFGREWDMSVNGNVLGVKLRYRWTKPDDEFVVESVDADGKAQVLETYRWNASKQHIEASSGQGPAAIWMAQPDGSIHSRAPGTARIVIRRLTDGAVQTAMEEKVNGEWRMSKEMVRVIDASPTSIARERQRLQSAKGDVVQAPASDTEGAEARVDPVWGPLARLAGTSWAVHGGGVAVVAQFDWVDKGKTLRHKGGMVGLPMTEILFRPSGESGVVLGDITNFGDTYRNVRFRFNDEGVVVSDWYRRDAMLGMGGRKTRHEFRLTRDGGFEERQAMGDGKEEPPFPPLHGNFRAVDADTLKSMSAESSATVAELGRQAELERLEQQERQKEARDARWRAAMGIANGMLDAGLEVARARAAQSQHELDSKLADARALARAQQAAQAQASAARSGAGYTAAPVAPSGASPPATTAYTAVQGPGTGSWAGAGQNGSVGGARSAGPSDRASTRDDPSTCVSAPVTSTHRCGSMTGYKGMVSNTCSVPVDVRMCFMTASGWNCQSRYGLGPQQTWEPGWCHANTGEVFHAVRYSDGKEPLASP